jgi:hypothetical protein
MSQFLFGCYSLSTASQAQSSLSGLLHSGGPAERRWSQGTDLFDEISDNLGKTRAFSRRNPLEDKPLRIDSRELEELFHESRSFHRHVITVQVMAIPDVSAPHKDAVRPFLKGLQYLMRPDSCGTQRPDGPHVGGILQSAHSRQVRARVRTPIAEKADYRRFKLFVGHFLPLQIIPQGPVRSEHKSGRWKNLRVGHSPMGRWPRIRRTLCRAPCLPGKRLYPPYS